MTTKDYNPNIAIHPGNTLRDILESVSMSQTDLAERTGLTLKTVNEIIQGKNPVTPETALKLSAVFGMSSNFWNNLERNYQESLARIEQIKKLEEEIPRMKKFTCYKDLVKWGYVSESKEQKEKVSSLLHFFRVSSLDFVQKTHQVAFRKSKQGKLSHESLAAWLRCGEIEAEKIDTKPFDREKLLGHLNDLRALTQKDVPEIYKGLRTICSDVGIAVVFVPYFPNTFVDGATRWLSADKALIQVSLRGASVDRFWFTFFHEIGHLIKHGKKDQLVEFEDRSGGELELKEKEADDFASKTLISDISFKEFLSQTKRFSDDEIYGFAKKIGIAPAIVAGRVAHDLAEKGDVNVWRKFGHLRGRLRFGDAIA